MLFSTTLAVLGLMAATNVQADFSLGVREGTGWGQRDVYIITSGGTKCEEVADWYGEAPKLSGWTTDDINKYSEFEGYIASDKGNHHDLDLPMEHVCGSRKLWLRVPAIRAGKLWVYDNPNTDADGKGAIGQCDRLNDDERVSCSTGSWFHGHSYTTYMRCKVDSVDC